MRLVRVVLLIQSTVENSFVNIALGKADESTKDDVYKDGPSCSKRKTSTLAHEKLWKHRRTDEGKALDEQQSEAQVRPKQNFLIHTFDISNQTGKHQRSDQVTAIRRSLRINRFGSIFSSPCQCR